jgi:hypothetical protein
MSHASLELPDISDEYMREHLAAVRQYTVVILKHGPAYESQDARAIIFEHGRRNFALRKAGLLSIVCPISDGTEYAGIGVFGGEPAEVERIMAGDPAVQAGVLTFEVHQARSFPGDRLP